jgi:hypothetical protein
MLAYQVWLYAGMFGAPGRWTSAVISACATTLLYLVLTATVPWFVFWPLFLKYGSA